HQGPGNYMSSSGYNAFGSAVGGYSDALFGFLVNQVAGAIKSAASKAQASTLRLYHQEIGIDYKTPFVVNRSPPVFVLNWDASCVLKHLGPFAPATACPDSRLPGEPEDGWELPGCPRLRAVNRRVAILEARTLGGNRLADLVFFAVHPTVLLHSAPLYN